MKYRPKVICANCGGDRDFDHVNDVCQATPPHLPSATIDDVLLDNFIKIAADVAKERNPYLDEIGFQGQLRQRLSLPAQEVKP